MVIPYFLNFDFVKSCVSSLPFSPPGFYKGSKKTIGPLTDAETEDLDKRDVDYQLEGWIDSFSEVGFANIALVFVIGLGFYHVRRTEEKLRILRIETSREMKL